MKLDPTPQPSFATFETERIVKPDGRTITYYSWADVATPGRGDDDPPPPHPEDDEPDEGAARV